MEEKPTFGKFLLGILNTIFGFFEKEKQNYEKCQAELEKLHYERWDKERLIREYKCANRYKKAILSEKIKELQSDEENWNNY